jgi:hypothetical protein
MPPVKHFLRKLNGLICILLAGIYRLAKTALRSTSYPRRPVKLALLISRPQDIDLLIDVYLKTLQRQDVSAVFWTTERAANRFSGVLERLSDYHIKPHFSLKHASLLRAVAQLGRIDALLTTVESTLAAHKIPYLLTKVANAAGIQTFTLQHGFENVGLTYSDGTYGPHIRFAAQTVFTWGPVQNLPMAVSDETRRKCIAVGCPKLHLTIPAEEERAAADRSIIAVFEGLHATRFDDRYTIQFFKDLQEIAQNFAKLDFILKPHPGALVRTRRHAESLDSLRGVEVLDPTLPESAHWTTPRLIALARAVITTPSTIALDAALAKTPVAVVRYGQMIPYYAYYEPLPLIDTQADWEDFLNKVSLDPEFLEPRRKAFLDKVILPGDAADRLLDVVGDHAQQVPKK